MGTSIFTTASAVRPDFDRAMDLAFIHEQKRLNQTHSLFINGRACKSSAEPFVNHCPADTRVPLGRFQSATGDHVAKAVAAARKAFPFWRELGWEQRLAFVRKAAENMAKHPHNLAALLCLEIGKNRREAYNEVQEAIELIRYYCNQMEINQGYRLTNAINGSQRFYDLLEPYGVWAVVAPFDSPLEVSASMLTSALVAGNTVVYKPSSKSPLTGLRLTDLFHQSGLPIGIVNCLTGPGPAMGKELSQHPDIKGFSFTGSQSAGLAIYQQFTRYFPKPCIVEMRGKNPTVVLPTANLEDAAEGIIRSAFAMNGQISSACSRVYAHRQISEELSELLAEKVRELTVGNPVDRGTVIGPLIDEKSIESFRRAVRLGRKDGRLLTGGGVLRKGEFAHGHYVEPTVVTGLKQGTRLFAEEFPVPVLGLMEIKSVEEAIALCNTGQYGLVAGLYTQVDSEQEQFFEGVQAGAVVCNRRDGATRGSRAGLTNFGEWKASGSTGRNACSPYYLTQFMREQCRTICW